jgi:hypothetical protein
VSEKKKTGLGASAFFQRNQPDGEQGNATATARREEMGSIKLIAPPKPEKVRTTVMLQKKTLAAMELLKVEARKQGIKATLGDVLEEAIQSLMEKKKLELKGLDQQ